MAVAAVFAVVLTANFSTFESYQKRWRDVPRETGASIYHCLIVCMLFLSF